MRRLMLIAAVALLGTSGCGDQPDSSSNTASSPVSIKAPHAYKSDLENTVVLAMRRGESKDELRRQIGLVANRHGLDDWESAEESFVAIGVGLREAEVNDEVAESIASLVSGGDAVRRQLVLDAYGR